MDHIAIMNKRLGMLPKIVSAEKTIESRWMARRIAPWGKVRSSDTVYFKNTGEQVTVRARVEQVIQYENLNPKKVKAILAQHGAPIGIAQQDVQHYYKQLKAKQYCVLVFLCDVKKIKPFEINKKGFGAMSAWVSVEDVHNIKL